MNLLFAGFDFFSNLRKPNVIAALVLAVIALVVMIIAKKIAAKFLPDGTDEQRLGLAVKIKVGCAVLALVACLVAVIF